MLDVLNVPNLTPYGSRAGSGLIAQLGTVPRAEAWPVDVWSNVPISPDGYRDSIGRLAAEQTLAGPLYLRGYPR